MQYLQEAWHLIDIGAVASALFVTTRVFDSTFGAKHWLLILVVAVTMLFVYALSDLYFRRRTRYLLEDTYLLFREWGKVLLVVLALGYLTGTYTEYDRNVILSWALAAFVAQLGVHLAIQSMLHYFRRRGLGMRNALLVGHDASLSRFGELLASNPWLGIRAVGYVCEDDWALQNHAQDADRTQTCDEMEISPGVVLRRLGRLEDIDILVRTQSIDDIFVTLPLDQSRDLETFAPQLLNCPAAVSWVPGISMTGAMATRVGSIADEPLIRLSDSPLRGGKQTLKRAMDLVISLVLIFLSSPVLLAISVLVKTTSPGPVLFKQQRRGHGGMTIKVWKFRTMRQLPEGEVQQQATSGDERITTVGALLRRWSLDELPQLFNVLQGRMSMVGPRPHPLWLDNEFAHQIDIYRQRNRVKPGITGWAQVNGHRGETETRHKMELRLQHDLYYINHWSIWLDIKILLLTVPAILSRTNAY